MRPAFRDRSSVKPGQECRSSEPATLEALSSGAVIAARCFLWG